MSREPAQHPAAPRPGEVPTATYRVQLNAGFDFAAAAELAPYLRDLGVSHCYASPYLKARPGSSHGYDIIDHNALNPELGGEDAYRQWTHALQRCGLGQILDFVPNHMGVMGGDNQWWLDVLENGPASVHADYFDVDWRPLKPELRGKVLLPVLGDHYGVVLEGGQLHFAFDPREGSFHTSYYEHRFPIDPREYAGILQYRLPALESALAPDDPALLEYKSLITAFEHLPSRDAASAAERDERQRDKEIHKRRLAELYHSSAAVARVLDETVAGYNGEPGDTESFAALHRLLERQAYRLAYWQTASDEINYRRFFDINDLAGIRMENPGVFAATHRLVLELIGAGTLHGLRLDHPDGLYDPADYFARLHSAMAEAAGGRAYLVVEKILASHEHLRESWRVAGTTGYETANLINGLFVDPRGERPLDRIYRRFSGERRSFDAILQDCKRRVMQTSLGSELNVLANQLNRISEADPRTRDYTLSALRNALLEVVAAFPVYRTYITGTSVTEEDRRYVDWAVAQAKKRSTDVETSIFDFVHDVLLLEAPDEAAPASWVRFAMRFQQYTAPVMAKGLEDTAFYVYNRLVSLNEVGGDPRRFNATLGAFHHLNQERIQHWPHTLISTTTHDTKRSEDVRARINALSELAAEWQTQLVRWSRLNRSKKVQVNDQAAPTRNEEYLLYQSLLGVWPLDPAERAGLAERVRGYMLKAAKEAKVNTSWINPNPEYEEALSRFVDALLEPSEHNLFLEAFLPFQEKVARIGLYNSLSQALLKLTAPGVPDIYQGNELWDFSLVDPDNRRAVDYAQRQRLLAQLKETPGASPRPESVRPLVERPEDGRIKLYLTWRALGLRNARAALFRDGEYVPLEVSGVHAERVCAFARSHAGRHVLVLVPRLLAGLLERAAAPLGAVWADTALMLPPDWGGLRWHNEFTGAVHTAEHGADAARLPLSDLLADFPVALLAGEQTG